MLAVFKVRAVFGDYGTIHFNLFTWDSPMLPNLWNRRLAVTVFVCVIASPQLLLGAMLLNYQFEVTDGDPPSGRTTPDSSGNFASVAGTVNAVLGHGTQTPGVDFPNLVSGPVANFAAGVMSRNANSAMNFPGNPATGNITTSIERVEIADASSGALDGPPFSKFTVALWLNPSSTDRDRFAVGKMGQNSTSVGRGWQISSPAGSQDLVVDYFETASSTVSRSLKVSGGLPLSAWSHVIFAFDGTNLTEAIYINNVPQTVDSTVSTTPIPATLNGSNGAPFRVGHRGATGNTVGSWAGGIDDVVIFNETLAFTPTGSADGTGSLLLQAQEVPEPGSLVYALICLGLTSATRRRVKRKA